MWIDHLAGPKVLSVSLNLLSFRDIAHFLFRGHVTSEIKNSRKWVTLWIDHPAGPKFSSVSLYLLPFSTYHSLPVSRVTRSRKLKMAENGLPCHLNTQRVPNFCPFHSISYRFRDIVNFLFSMDTWPRKLKMAKNGLPCQLNTQRVTHFRPLRSIFYCFRDIIIFLFWGSWTSEIKMAKNG